MTTRSTTWSVPTAAPSPMVGRLHEMAIMKQVCAAWPSTYPARATTTRPEPSPMWWLCGERLIRNPTMTVLGRVTHGKSGGKTVALRQLLALEMQRSGRRMVVFDEISAVETFRLSTVRGEPTTSPTCVPTTDAAIRYRGW